MLKTLLSGYFQQNRLQSFGLLALRLAAGIALAFHGYGKIQQGATTWFGDAVPPALQGLATFCEFGGGLAMVLGLLTPLSMLGVICTMIGALGLVHIPYHDPYVSPKGGSSAELATVYLTTALLLLFNGPGIFSLDYLFCKGKCK